MSGSAGRSTLVVIDMQVVFADPGSPWCAPGFAAAVPGVRALLDAVGDDAVFTRFVAPERPSGAWVEYYRQWPFALQPPTAALWDLVPELEVGTRAVLDAPTFGKWDDRLRSLVDSGIVLAGVSTDCCVLSTALAAADAGVAVRVAADACAGASDADHERALAAMALYAPLITVTSVAEVLEDVADGRVVKGGHV